MSDYLTNVIARTFAIEPAIRPRLVSLYEPARNDLPVLAREVEAEVPRRESKAESRTEPLEPSHDRQVQPAPKERTRVQVSSPSLPRSPAKEPTRLDTVRHTVASMPPLDTRQSMPQPRAPLSVNDEQTANSRPSQFVAEPVVIEARNVSTEERVRLTSHSQPPEQKQPPPVDETAREHHASPPHSVELKNLQSDAQQARVTEFKLPQQEESVSLPAVRVEKIETSKETLIPVTTTRVEREIHEATKVITRTSPAHPTTAPVSPNKVVHPISVAPAPSQPAVEDNARQPKASEPTIQVTIGRVEVRAIAGEERRGPALRKSRLMNLDDYLRQRTQGVKS